MKKMGWKLTMLALLMMLQGTPAFAQQDDQFSIPAPAKAEEPMEISASLPHMTSYGFAIPPGWNAATAVDALGIYDSNPASLLQPSGDEAQRYSGYLSLSYLAKHTVYQLTYLPSFTYYHHFSTLNSVDQNLSQSIWHQVDRKTSWTWLLDSEKYPSWGGSAFSNSAFGVLLMQLAGLTSLNLQSKVTNANTGFTLDHKPTLRSSVQLNVSGGVTKYVHSNSDQILGLLTAGNSSTWYGQMGFVYGYQLDAHRRLGAGVSTSYFLFTAENYHLMEESVVLRYEQQLSNHWIYSVGAGPQFCEQQDPKTLQTGLGLNADVERKTLRSSFHANVSSSYQPGQAQGTLTGWMVSSSFEHSVGKHGFAGVFGTYQSSVAIASKPAGQGTTLTLAPALDGGYRISRHLVWFANYGYGLNRGVLTHQKSLIRQQFLTGLSFNVDRLFER
jgi:hypothetical protein